MTDEEIMDRASAEVWGDVDADFDPMLDAVVGAAIRLARVDERARLRGVVEGGLRRETIHLATGLGYTLPMDAVFLSDVLAELGVSGGA